MKVCGKALGLAKAFMLLLGVWLLALLFMTGSFHTSIEVDDQISRRLNRAMDELDTLKMQNNELQQLLKDLAKSTDTEDLQAKLQSVTQKADGSLAGTFNEPNKDYEITRRRIENGVKEFWYYISAQLRQIHDDIEPKSAELASRINDVLEDGAGHRRSLLTDLNRLQEVDGFNEWREKEAQDLSELVQQRLSYLQNPVDCSAAKKLVCNLNKGCGYGCQIHHLVYCFIIAYGSQRTLIVKSKGWRYHHGGWEEIFLPVSETCLSPSGTSHSPWPGSPDTQVVDLPIVDSLSPRPPFLPLAIPKDLSERMTRLHGDPIVWWIGQFLKYLLRPQPKTQKALEAAAKKLGFQKPIVGVHIRRTDKVGTEASFHALDEYMGHVDEFFKTLEMREPVEQRHVYLASDDPKVIQEAQLKYPQYKILGDTRVAKSAAVSTRYSSGSLQGIIADINFLSLCDYLVCTFSSQVCRIAYEIMQTMHPDASTRFRSLDDIYYYGGQSAHNQVAIYPHSPRRPAELELEPGDIVGVAGNHWDGYSKGKNLRTRKVGLYPSYKVQDKVQVADFPTYEKANQKSLDG